MAGCGWVRCGPLVVPKPLFGCSDKTCISECIASPQHKAHLRIEDGSSDGQLLALQTETLDHKFTDPEFKAQGGLQKGDDMSVLDGQPATSALCSGSATIAPMPMLEDEDEMIAMEDADFVGRDLVAFEAAELESDAESTALVDELSEHGSLQGIDGTKASSRGSSSSSSSSSSNGSSSPARSASPAAAADRPRRGLEHDPEIFEWGNGGFLFTWKSHGVGGTKAAWQVMCRHHSCPGNPCRRTRSLLTDSNDPASAASRLILCRLKCWALSAVDASFQVDEKHGERPCGSRGEHQQLPRDWLYGLQYDEATLDSMVH